MNPITTTQLENTQTMTLPSSITAPVPDINSFTTPTPQMQEQQTQVNRAKKQQTDTLGNIFTGLTALGERGATQMSLEEQAGIPTLSKELVDIENQLRQKDLEFRREREAVMSRPGLTMASANAELSQLARTQNSQLADLEVIRQARSNSLTNAQSLIDRKVELEFGDKKAKVDALKFIYDENKDLLSKEEDKLLSETIRREERAFNLAKSNFEQLENSKMELVKNASERGAPNSTLQSILNSKTIGEAYKNAGGYAKSLDAMIKNKQLDKLAKEIKQMEEPIAVDAVAGSKNAIIAKILNSAKNKSDLSQTEREQLSKMGLVVSQLDTLQSSISKSNKTGIIKGRVNNVLANLGANPDAGYINAQIQALIPNVARGIYGEVGVLTDADIENYKKTLPNIKTVEDQNNLVLAMTLRNAVKSYENILNTGANSGINVSGWAQDYADLINQVNEVEDRIGMSKVRVQDFVKSNPSSKPMIEELIMAGATDREITQILGIQ